MNMFKIKYLLMLCLALAPLAAMAADTLADAGRFAAEQRQTRLAACKADPEKCRAERQARFEQRFKFADRDGNGVISRVEAEKAMPRLLRRFDRIDTDHDGQISKEEILAARKARYEGRRDTSGTQRPNI